MAGTNPNYPLRPDCADVSGPMLPNVARLGKIITDRAKIKLGLQKVTKDDPEYWAVKALVNDDDDLAKWIADNFKEIRHPLTFEELKATFSRDYLQRFAQNEFLQQDIEKAKNWKELGEDHLHYFISDKDILVSGDGIQFVVCVEWDKNNIINVLGIAQALGWKFEIVK